MQSHRSNRFSAALRGVAVVCALWAAPTISMVAAQPAPGAGVAADKELGEAMTRAREGKVDEALRLIKEKAAKHPEWPPSQLILARLLFSSNQVAPARHALEKAAAEAPEHPDVYLTFGNVALQEGRFSDARLNFDKVRGIAKSGQWDAEKSKMISRESLAGLASVAEARDDWKGAQEFLTGWLELEPKNGAVRQRLGRALFQTGKIDDAFATLTRAVNDVPTLDPAPVWMALLYSQKGDLKMADEWFDKAQKADPKSARVRLAHAAWLLDQNRAPLARTEIDEAVKLDPGLKEAQRIQGLVAWHLRDLSDAQAILEPLHRDAPADSVVANLLALTLVDQPDATKRSRGLQLAEVNAMQFPRSPEMVATLGWALYRAGRIDEAEQKLRAAVAGGRTTPDVAYFLARVLAEKGQTDAARQLLQSATNLPRAFAHRDDAMSLLKTLKK